MKTCERCKAFPAEAHERFCKHCRKVVLNELRSSGYLAYVPTQRHRSADEKEDTRETKHGVDR